MKPILYIFAGLPGSGKTTLARQLARELNAVYLRIDSIEQALRDAGSALIGPEGYVVAYRLAADNLRQGLPVVADSVNPLQLTRSAWHDVAFQCEASYLDIEICCSDRMEHRRRIESRAADIPGFRLPIWDEVESHAYEPWETLPITLDTAGRTVERCMDCLRKRLT